MAENRQEEARRAQEIRAGETALGIELGSTNIKAVLVGKDCQTLASASYGWENQLEDGIWTYDLEQVWAGIQTCFTEIKAQVSARYQAPLQTLGSIGVSAMRHGYLPFASDGRQLAAFLQELQAAGKTLIIATHHPELFAELDGCELQLADGHIAAGRFAINLEIF